MLKNTEETGKHYIGWDIQIKTSITFSLHGEAWSWDKVILAMKICVEFEQSVLYAVVGLSQGTYLYVDLINTMEIIKE